jgi:hypothetical protein
LTLVNEEDVDVLPMRLPEDTGKPIAVEIAYFWATVSWSEVNIDLKLAVLVESVPLSVVMK